VNDRLMGRPMRIERGDLLNLELLLDKVARDEGQPEDVRSDAGYWASVIDEMLVFGSPSPERWVSLVPAGFHIKHYYSIIVEQTIAELPDDVKSQVPAHQAMARTMAAQADDGDIYCTDHRLDCVSALEELLVSLQRKCELEESQEV
jgi:hypothetical protein